MTMNASNNDEQLRSFLRTIPVFQDLSVQALDAAVKHCSRKSVQRGEYLIKKTDTSDTMYFVLHGRFSIITNQGVIAQVSAGEPIGELSFLAGGGRSADVQAARNSDVLALSRSAYDALSIEHPEIPNVLLKSISKRLAIATQSSGELRPQAGQINAIVPATGQVLPEALLQGVKNAFDPFPGWSVLTAADVPQAELDKAGSLGSWLQNRTMAGERLVLLCADAIRDANWHQMITQHCDVVVLAGEMFDGPGENAVPDETERDVLAATLATNAHFLCYRENRSTKIEHTNRWLADRPVGLIHQVGLDCPADFDRIVRFLRGVASGLVLSGGGAFGTAHLGAIKALQERGITFDMYGGTSSGAAVAAVLAMGMEPSDAIDICQDIFVTKKVMSKFTFPVYSMINHSDLDTQLRVHYGAYQIEDMPLNFFAVATSLTFNDIKLMRSGPLWKAVRASTSLPGLLPPMVLPDGEVLVDGGLLDNVPVSVMHKSKSGANIVFNFSVGKDWRSNAAYNKLPGRLGALAILLRLKKPMYPRFPTIFSILSRTMVVGARKLMQQTNLKGDILIELQPIKGMGFLDWRKARLQFDAAYVEMIDVLDNLDIKTAATNDAERTHYLAKLAQHFSTPPS
ncbi:patatin-like phospholipase family protein [Octadecabacter sp. 1_MG-2023]|uniref:patatin-like phospholipase family protein n=1 Tax=unclassified Octadecabacter TaxID=196158 RepID=UPI001C09DBB1|nr:MULTISPECIES: patatin-like phospholipase family protein [unclassified Octadecabacter]MBU2994426.1 patatin-like phospholipase family protein [Octadecabacter sp. B2R22]MDO6734283.1 patatin-like phospholipase family protein [Octadecabacter sp. 1_MG-2023]